MIKAHVTSRLQADEIDEVLGDRRYAERAYFPELRDRLLGRHSTQLIGVSRHYLLMRPPVVVDFEPSPLEEKFFVDEKRRYFGERGIVYVPIFLGERLTKDQLLQRVHQERRVMEQARAMASEDAALMRARSEDPGIPLSDPVDLDRRALRQLSDEIRANPNLRGASRAKRLQEIRRSLALK